MFLNVTKTKAKMEVAASRKSYTIYFKENLHRSFPTYTEYLPTVVIAKKAQLLGLEAETSHAEEYYDMIRAHLSHLVKNWMSGKIGKRQIVFSSTDCIVGIQLVPIAPNMWEIVITQRSLDVVKYGINDMLVITNWFEEAFPEDDYEVLWTIAVPHKFN